MNGSVPPLHSATLLNWGLLHCMKHMWFLYSVIGEYYILTCYRLNNNIQGQQVLPADRSWAN